MLSRQKDGIFSGKIEESDVIYVKLANYCDVPANLRSMAQLVR